MKQRNLYRIIIGAFMLVSGLIITVFQTGRILFWHNSHNRRMCISGRGDSPAPPDTGMVPNPMSDRKRLALMVSLMPG